MGVLALVAPRGLMLINATRDAHQFSVGEGKKSLTRALDVFRLYGKPNNARQAVFESGHDYNQSMREAMYGWMTRHLKGIGDGSPIPEPKITTEAPETLRCFPGDSRPADFVTLPKFAAAEARRILRRRPQPKHAEQWQADEVLMRASLPRVLGGFPKPLRLPHRVDNKDGLREIEFQSEAGIPIFASRRPGSAKSANVAVLLDLGQGRAAAATELGMSLSKAGWDLVTADLRATGATLYPRDKIGQAPDHNTAEWSMWIGRPLLGQWVWDVRRLLDTLQRHAGGLSQNTALIGVGPASLVALCVAALDRRVARVATVGGLDSYVTETPYKNQRLGIMVPGILRDLGDIPQLATLCAPKPLVVANSVNAVGEKLQGDRLQTAYAWTRAVYKLQGVSDNLQVLADENSSRIVKVMAEA